MILQVGSGATPSSGYLAVFDVKGHIHGTEQVFIDTFGSKDKKKKKSSAMLMDSKPCSKGQSVCSERSIKRHAVLFAATQC